MSETKLVNVTQFDLFHDKFIPVCNFALCCILHGPINSIAKALSKEQLEQHVSPYDIGRLELYASNMADYHLVVDLLPCLARLFFTGQLQARPLHLSVVQKPFCSGAQMEEDDSQR
ncbi:RNA cytidine acetyltransferase [Plakobranchus ocellatus]|uniref:RNA cytidine acetyltransferase n=1 Tax=Plakobranchus ocellatus TaxID=259542 RepID=A0AAV3ZJR6_9GAST|nr:RNA cytidine acetyltransferase [Plakobranchus ocellatus]